MGNCCSSCARKKPITINSKNEERQSMLNVSQQQQASQETLTAKPKDKAEYGSAGTYQAPPQSGQTVTTATTRNIITNETSTQPKAADTVHRIPTSQANLVVVNAGSETVNGDYRWFLQMSKWCLFREESDGYSLGKGVSVDVVYGQLSGLAKLASSDQKDFRWNDAVRTCWTISNLDGSVIYYAASQSKENEEYIPNDKGDWIAVHGAMPPPEIFPDITKESTPPREDLVFGNDSEQQERVDKPMKPGLQPIAEDENVQGNDEDDQDEDDESLSQLEDDDDESLSSME